MTDLADHIPSPALIAARERFLQAAIDAPYWNPPAKKPNFNPKPKRAAPPPPPPDLLTIDLDQERQAVARLYAAWQEELAKKRALCEAASTDHTSPGDNYWLPEAKARARWLVAANFVEMLEGAHR